MDLNIASPAPDLIAALIAQHARRYPEKATIDVIGDGGATLRLPLLIANPSGAIRPADPHAFPAWAQLVGATLRGKGGKGVGAALVRDCLLYPDRGLLATWESRWPALVDAMEGVVLKKIGANFAAIRSPLPGEDPPASTAGVLAERPAATWRWIDRGPTPVPAVITPPSQPHWEAFTAALDRDSADCIALLDELVATCCRGEGVGALLAQWPGLALPIENVIVKMAGAAADARLGEW